MSLVRPCYNQTQFLKVAIRSVLLRAYPNLEYIVIVYPTQPREDPYVLVKRALHIRRLVVPTYMRKQSTPKWRRLLNG